ncbi:hypothetical protein JWJ90_22090 [Desulfobulbus rhabdoformis]|nr:hypothetical protein [Desulfobulbus rhabdoformis]MBM9616954.1 hypothetical protein [Desulfobulbus rhabdoformis]
MDLANFVHQHYDAFMVRFGKILLPDQRKALDAILRGRTPASWETSTCSALTVSMARGDHSPAAIGIAHVAKIT